MDAVASLLGSQTVSALPAAAPPNAATPAAASPRAFADLLAQVGAALPGAVRAADAPASTLTSAADTEGVPAFIGDQATALINAVPATAVAAAVTCADGPTMVAPTLRGEAAEAAPELPGLPIAAAPAGAAPASQRMSTDDELADVETAQDAPPDVTPDIATEVMPAVGPDLQPAATPEPGTVVPVTTAAPAASQSGRSAPRDELGSVADPPRMGRPPPAGPPLAAAEPELTAGPASQESAAPRPTGATKPLAAAAAKATTHAATSEPATVEAATLQPRPVSGGTSGPVKAAATPLLDIATSSRRGVDEASTPDDPPTPQAAVAARSLVQATPLSAPASPPPASPARQIAPVVVAVTIAGGTARLAVTLEPAELGRVEISVERRGETADVRVAAERPETLALLQRDQRELDRTLTQAGISAEGRSLTFSLSDGGGFASGRDTEGRGQAPRGPEGNTEEAVPAAIDAAPPRRLLSLLDLAI